MSSDLNNVGEDLCKLAELLNTYSLCSDVSALNTAGQSCITKSVEPQWLYCLGKITFEVDAVGGTIPASADCISVSLSMEIEGSVSTDITDPLSRLIFDIEIDGYRENMDELYASWHLDRHKSAPGDGAASYSHPMYHFTFGGNKMEEKGDFFGDTIILPSPRLMYPPMDAILGIDFILRNYISHDKLSRLIADPEYVRILKNSQERLWKPFFSSLYSFWDSTTLKPKDGFTPTDLFPLYYV